MMETKREKFVRLANKRTKTALDKMRLVANLANKANYDWSEEDMKKIISALENQLKLIKNRFTLKPKRDFKL